MERIRGKELKELSGKELDYAKNQKREELEKVIELGILPEDSMNLGNSIFTKKRETYLIDFESWRRTPKDELDFFRNYVL